jgi:hypothetical protein
MVAKATTTAPARQALAPVIDPHAVFTVSSAQAVLALPKGCLPREIRLGRLRASKRSGRYWVLGSWLLQWLEGGEIHRHRHEAADSNSLMDGGPRNSHPAG